MALVMHKRSKYWQIVIYNPSTRKHKWISSGTEDKFEAIKMEADFMSIAAGRKSKERIETFIEEISEIEIKREGLKIDSAWDFFMTEWGAERSPGTTRQKGSHFKRCLKWIKDNCPSIEYMSEINREIIGQYIKTELKKEKSANYNKIKNNISNVWDHLVSEVATDIKYNPWTNVISKAGDGQEKSHRAFTDAEIKKIKEYLPGSKYSDWVVPYEIAAYTGLRQNDCLLLKWKDIHLDKGVFMVDTKKKGKRVNVPIHPKVRTCLSTLETGKASDYLFPQLAQGYMDELKSVTGAWGSIISECNISIDDDLVSFKSIRHHFNTALQKKKISQEIRKRLTGQSSNEINDIYSHDFDGIRDAIMQLD